MPPKRLICKEKVVQISRTNKEELTSRIDAFITARRHLFDYLVLRADASWKGNPNCFLAFESPVFLANAGTRSDMPFQCTSPKCWLPSWPALSAHYSESIGQKSHFWNQRKIPAGGNEFAYRPQPESVAASVERTGWHPVRGTSNLSRHLFTSCRAGEILFSVPLKPCSVIAPILTTNRPPFAHVPLAGDTWSF